MRPSENSVQRSIFQRHKSVNEDLQGYAQHPSGSRSGCSTVRCKSLPHSWMMTCGSVRFSKGDILLSVSFKNLPSVSGVRSERSTTLCGCGGSQKQSKALDFIHFYFLENPYNGLLCSSNSIHLMKLMKRGYDASADGRRSSMLLFMYAQYS